MTAQQNSPAAPTGEGPIRPNVPPMTWYIGFQSRSDWHPDASHQAKEIQ